MSYKNFSAIDVDMYLFDNEFVAKLWFEKRFSELFFVTDEKNKATESHG